MLAGFTFIPIRKHFSRRSTLAYSRQSFFWVDIDGKCFHEYKWSEEKVNRWQLDHRVSLIIETHDSDILILGLQGGIASFDLVTEKLDWLLELEKEITNNRTNDGGCDPQGEYGWERWIVNAIRVKAHYIV